MRMIVISLIASIIAISAAASELVGSIVPPYPGGLSSDMGSCIPDGDEFCAYAIASLNRPDGSVAAVAAKQFIDEVGGEPRWKIIDVLDAPALADGQMWAFEECNVNGMLDPSAAGIVTAKDMGGWLETGKTVWAVKFDTDANKLAVLQLSKVRCVLPGS